MFQKHFKAIGPQPSLSEGGELPGRPKPQAGNGKDFSYNFLNKKNETNPQRGAPA